MSFTYTASAEQDIEVILKDRGPLPPYDWDWSFTFRASGSECPPPTPEDCAIRNGNVWFDEPTEIDGVMREGCYYDPDSCLNEMSVQFSLTECDSDDVLYDIFSGGTGVVTAIGGGLVATPGFNPSTGAQLGPRLVTAGTGLIVVGGLTITVIIATESDQVKDLLDEFPDVIDGFPDRNPNTPDHNPGNSPIDAGTIAKIAAETCAARISVDAVRSVASSFNLVPEAILDNGRVDFGPGEPMAHLCDLVPTYMPGGSNHGNRSAIQKEASFHIRDVLYGEQNKPETWSPSQPGAVQPENGRGYLQVLTRAETPSSTTSRDWYKTGSYDCVGQGAPGTPGATACDEWPWYRTAEGGPGSAHLRIINSKHNSNSGTDWNPGFTTRCSVDVGDTFLVIPLPKRAIQSGFPSQQLGC